MFPSKLFSSGLLQNGWRGNSGPLGSHRVGREVFRALASRHRIVHSLASRVELLNHRRPLYSICAPPNREQSEKDRDNGYFGRDRIWIQQDSDEVVIEGASLLSLLALLSPSSDSEEQKQMVEKSETVQKAVMMIFAGACITVATLIVAAAVFAFVLQRRRIYFPSKLIEWTPGDYKLNYTEDLYLEAKDRVKIHCWFVKSKNYQKVPTLLFFHGNAGNISHRLDHVIKLKEMDCNIFLVSYRGYGLSEGYPSERGLALDAQASLDYLLKRTDIDTKKIIVFGSALGGGVGINLVANNPKKVAALILENTFTSIEEMTMMLYPFLSPLTFLVQDKYKNEDKIKDLELPLMFVSGRADTLIPPAMMDRLFDVANQTRKKHMTKIPNGDHNDTWMQPGYATAIMSFVEETLGSLEEQSTDPKS